MDNGNEMMSVRGYSENPNKPHSRGIKASATTTNSDITGGDADKRSADNFWSKYDEIVGGGAPWQQTRPCETTLQKIRRVQAAQDGEAYDPDTDPILNNPARKAIMKGITEVPEGATFFPDKHWENIGKTILDTEDSNLSNWKGAGYTPKYISASALNDLRGDAKRQRTSYVTKKSNRVSTSSLTESSYGGAERPSFLVGGGGESK
jgi:hypothetical protein